MTLAEEHKWIFQCNVSRVIDGDTLRITVDKGWRDSTMRSVRLAGVDTPEIFSGPPEIRELGKDVRDTVDKWVLLHMECRPKNRKGRGDSLWFFWVHTDRDRQSFNRYVALDFQCCSGHSLVEYLKDEGHGV